MKPFQHLPVALQSLRVKTIFFGLDPAPLERESQSLQAKVLSDIEVPLGVSPVTRPAATVPGFDTARQLPVGPLIAVVPLNLMSRRGHAPQKVFRKSQECFGNFRGTFQFTRCLNAQSMQLLEGAIKTSRNWKVPGSFRSIPAIS